MGLDELSGQLQSMKEKGQANPVLSQWLDSSYVNSLENEIVALWTA